MVPIYRLTFLHSFKQLGWQEQGQATGAHSVAWIRSYDSWSSDLAAQRLLRFDPQCHCIPHLQAIEPAFVQRVSVVTWPARLDTECRDLPTEVVPIYPLAFLHAFELLGWQELGQVTGAHSVVWIRSFDGWASDFAACLLYTSPSPRD